MPYSENNKYSNNCIIFTSYLTVRYWLQIVFDQPNILIKRNLSNDCLNKTDRKELRSTRGDYR